MQLLTGIILVIAILVLIFASIALLVYITQERFFFYPTKLSPNYPYSQFPPHQELFYETPNNGYINGLLFKAKSPNNNIVMYSHGNSRALDDWAWIESDFTSLGYDVLVYDYRTYGKSKGKLNESNLYADARYIYYQLQKAYSDSQIVLYGRSLGASMATQLATEFPSKLLILETPFSSMLSMVAASTPYLPVKYLLRYKFNNKRKMKKLKCPVHIFHGTQDELIPLRHSQKLIRANKNEESSLTIIEGANHNNVTQFEGYHKKLKELLN